MTLTSAHIDFEKSCRQIFLGRNIRGVVYGEVKYYVEEGDPAPLPFFRTRNPAIDSLDHSIYFQTQEKAIYIFWDNTFVSYGLAARLIHLSESTNSYEQKWNVSGDPKWRSCIGRQIIDFAIQWDETWSVDSNGNRSLIKAYPQSFSISLDNGSVIIISAAELARSEQEEVYPLMDNLLVTTDLDLATHLKLIK